MISRLSIRARLAIAFAAALLCVLVLAGAFVYLRVDDTLTNGLDDRLETQALELTAIAAGGEAPEGPLPGPTDERGRLLADRHAGRPGARVLAPRR